MATEEMKAIPEASRAESWLAAAEYLMNCPDWTAHNLIVEVANPSQSSAEAIWIESELDGFLTEHDAQPLQTVAETIFPSSEYVRYGRDGVYERYPEDVYPEIHDNSENQWGTYAHRLLERTGDNGEKFNPLRDCVEKLQRELEYASSMRGISELDVVDSGFDLRTYDARRDRRRRRNSPCLSHLSFKLGPGSRLLLTAMYRYHYYMERFLGNLLGLAQLQQFVCDEVGLEPGRIVCVSTLAKLDTDHWTRKEVRALVERLRKGPS